MRQNRYPASCHLCNGLVAANAGVLIEVTESVSAGPKWKVEHLPSRCLMKASASAMPAAEAEVQSTTSPKTVVPGESLDAGGGMACLRCRDCGHVDDAHECDGLVKQHQEWFLYVWTDVFVDYAAGVAVALARTHAEAVKIAQEKCGSNTMWQNEIATTTPERHPVDQAFAFTLAGGG